MDLANLYGLTGKRAIVCGSTQGIGKACAVLFAELGAAVTLVARDAAKLAATAKELSTAHGQSHDFVAVDFNKIEELRDAVAAHLAKIGTAHILVNNTGGPPSGAILAARPDDFLLAFSRHLLANQLLAQTVIPGMKSAGYGRIVNIVSTSVREPIPGLGVSNTTRGAVASWAKTLSREVAPFQITVNNILPGATKTGRMDELIRAKAQSHGVPEQKLWDETIAAIPMGRMAEASETAAAVAFLASPAASYITGVSLAVDGGRTSCI